MNAYGSASAGRNASDANFRRNTIVVGSGASTASTMVKLPWRTLATPGGGKMIFFQLAATSAALKGEPSWNLTPSRILNVKVLPSSVGVGNSVQRSQTSGPVTDGSFGSARIRTL